MNRIATSTSFNNLKILDGTFTAQQFQVGANANETIAVSIASMQTDDLGRYYVDAINTTARQGTGSAVLPATSPVTVNSIAAQTLTVAGSRGTSTVSVDAGATAFEIAAAVSAT